MSVNVLQIGLSVYQILRHCETIFIFYFLPELFSLYSPSPSIHFALPTEPESSSKRRTGARSRTACSASEAEFEKCLSLCCRDLNLFNASLCSSTSESSEELLQLLESTRPLIALSIRSNSFCAISNATSSPVPRGTSLKPPAVPSIAERKKN